MVALPAREQAAQYAPSTFDGRRPRAICPWRVVAHVLVVAAFEFGHPVLLFIFVKSNYPLIHCT